MSGPLPGGQGGWCSAMQSYRPASWLGVILILGLHSQAASFVMHCVVSPRDDLWMLGGLRSAETIVSPDLPLRTASWPCQDLGAKREAL